MEDCFGKEVVVGDTIAYVVSQSNSMSVRYAEIVEIFKYETFSSLPREGMKVKLLDPENGRWGPPPGKIITLTAPTFVKYSLED